MQLDIVNGCTPASGSASSPVYENLHVSLGVRHLFDSGPRRRPRRRWAGEGQRRHCEPEHHVSSGGVQLLCGSGAKPPSCTRSLLRPRGERPAFAQFAPRRTLPPPPLVGQSFSLFIAVLFPPTVMWKLHGSPSVIKAGVRLGVRRTCQPHEPTKSFRGIALVGRSVELTGTAPAARLASHTTEVRSPAPPPAGTHLSLVNCNAPRDPATGRFPPSPPGTAALRETCGLQAALTSPFFPLVPGPP